MSKKVPKGARKQLAARVGMILVFLTGLLIMSYPFYIDALNHFIDQRRVVEVQKENQSKSNQQAAKMRKKNEELAKKGILPGVAPFDEVSNQKVSNGEYKKHLIGAILIPKIEVNIPLFDTTNERLLQLGGTVLQGTSYPTGGESTHTVVSAHSGLPHRKLFTDLEELQLGDTFIFNVLGEKMAYEVDNIQIVEPNETSSLKIESGRDIATLLTCTPYMINSHRLLVTGHRIPYTEDLAAQEKEADKWKNMKQLLILIGITLATLLLLYLLYRGVYLYRLKKKRFDLKVLTTSGGNPAKGIEYALYTANGKTPVTREQLPMLRVADDKGQVIFTDLPGGLYQVKTQNLAFQAGLKKLGQAEAKAYPKKNQPIENEAGYIRIKQ